MRPLRVVHLKDILVHPEDGNLGGMERSLMWLAERQRALGWSVEIWVAHCGPEPPPGLAVPVRKIYPYDHRRPDHVLRFVRELRHADPDVLHTHGYWAGALGRLAACLARVPVRVHKVASAYRREYRWTHRTTERVLAALTGRVIAVSRDVRDFLVLEIGISPDRVVIIPNGVPEPHLSGDRARARAELGLQPTDFLVAGLQRLDTGKGLFDIIQAVTLARSSLPGIKLLLAGDGPLRADVERAVSQQLGPGVVRFTGWLWDTGPILEAADAFVLASEEREGFSTALVSAMAARVPVVATRVGGNMDAVEDGVHGRLVSPRDPRALMEALVAIGRDPEPARRMAEAARRRYEELFRLEATSERVGRLYQELIEAKIGRVQ